MSVLRVITLSPHILKNVHRSSFDFHTSWRLCCFCGYRSPIELLRFLICHCCLFPCHKRHLSKGVTVVLKQTSLEGFFPNWPFKFCLECGLLMTELWISWNKKWWSSRWVRGEQKLSHLICHLEKKKIKFKWEWGVFQVNCVLRGSW